MEALYEEENDHSSLRKASGSYNRFSRKLRKSLIVAFTSPSKHSKSYRLNIFLSLCLAFVSMTQALSLILHRHDDIGEYESLSKVFALINYLRLDTLAYDLGVVNEFFYCMLAVIYTPLVILIVNVSQHLYMKRKPNWLSVKVMAIVLNLLDQILLLPTLILMLTVVKYTYLTNDSQMLEYDGEGEVFRSKELAAASLATIPILIGLLYMNSYFFYKNVFAKRRKLVYAMRDSFVHRVHIFASTGMVLCYCFLSMQSKIWYKVGIMLLCGVMFMLYTTQLSYYNMILNIENASKKAILVWSVISYLVGYACNSASVIVIMILFVSPVLVILIYFHIQDKMQVLHRTRIQDISSAHEVELKLRIYLESMEKASGKDEMEEIHVKVEKLFRFATEQFPRSPLMPLWEALYYDHYRKNASTALLKLSKAHMTESTLESQFFISKTEQKLLDSEHSPERMYLRYLKLVDLAKRADELCCLQLVNVCTELLSHKLDSKKFDVYVKRLSAEIDKTTGKYFRILQLYNDNEDVLDLLGSFMFDILKENEGRNYSAKAKMLRNNEMRRGVSSGFITNTLFGEQYGLLVVSCCIQFPGEILIANQMIYDSLKCTKIDLLSKSLKTFLPEDFRPFFTQTLVQTTLFGTWLDCISQLFTLILDSDGFLVPTTITTKITTWNNKPRILLMLTPRDKADVVLVDSQFHIKAHSKMNISGKPGLNVSFIGCWLDELFPGLSEKLRENEEEFVYQIYETSNYIVSSRKIDFRDIHFLFVSLQPALRSSRHSTITSLIANKRLPEDVKKGVRFNPEEKTVMLNDSKHDLMLTSQDHNPAAMYTETEMRMKKRYEITASVATTSSSSYSAELLQGVKVSQSLRRVRLLLMLSFLLLVTGLIASVIFMVNILDSLKSITTIRDYSERNLEIINLAYEVRSLMLSDDRQFAYERDKTSAAILTTSDELNKLSDFMKSLVGKGSKEADIFLTQQKVPMWTHLESSYSFLKMNLLDALYSYTAAASRLSTTTGPYTPQSDAFYVLRNGVSDLLDVVNMTLSMSVRSEEAMRENSLAVISYLIYMCCALILLPLFFLVAPQFVWFERVSRSVWLEIYSLPRELVLDVRNAAAERLMNFFSNEILLENPTAPKHINRSARPTTLWPELVRKIGLYLVLNIAFFVVIEVVYLIPVEELAVTIPNYLFWIGMRPRLVAESLFWNRENMMLGHDVEQFFTLVPEGQLRYNPAKRISNTTTTISFVSKILIFGDSVHGVSSIKKSTIYTDFILTTTCDKVPFPGCENSDLGLGLTFSTKEWNQLSKALLREDTPNEQLFPLFMLLESKADQLISATNNAIELYKTDAIQQIDSISVQMITLTVLFILLIIILHFVLYSPTLSNMLTKARQAIRIHKILKSKI